MEIQELRRNPNFIRFENELMIDLNGQTLSKANNFIERSIDIHYGSRKKWNLKSVSSKFFVSKKGWEVGAQWDSTQLLGLQSYWHKFKFNIVPIDL